MEKCPTEGISAAAVHRELLCTRREGDGDQLEERERASTTLGSWVSKKHTGNWYCGTYNIAAMPCSVQNNVVSGYRLGLFNGAHADTYIMTLICYAAPPAVLDGRKEYYCGLPGNTMLILGI